MSGGILLTVAGVWVLCQVLGGDALGRLGIVASSSSQPEGSGLGPGVISRLPVATGPAPAGAWVGFGGS